MYISTATCSHLPFYWKYSVLFYFPQLFHFKPNFKSVRLRVTCGCIHASCSIWQKHRPATPERPHSSKGSSSNTDVLIGPQHTDSDWVMSLEQSFWLVSRTTLHIGLTKRLWVEKYERVKSVLMKSALKWSAYDTWRDDEGVGKFWVPISGKLTNQTKSEQNGNVGNKGRFLFQVFGFERSLPKYYLNLQEIRYVFHRWDARFERYFKYNLTKSIREDETLKFPRGELHKDQKNTCYYIHHHWNFPPATLFFTRAEPNVGGGVGVGVLMM